MLAVATLKRSLEFDPVEQGVKRKRAEIKLPPTPFTLTNTASSKQSSIFPKSSPSKESSSNLCSLTSSTASCSSTEDTPLFTSTQAAQMCTRLLREQDKLIREQYEQLLSTKLNEQYEQFIRYSHDNVYRTPSKHQFLHFGQQQESDHSSINPFSYVS